MTVQKDFPRHLADRFWVLGHAYFQLYLIAGERQAALIDTGISATADLVIGQLAHLGIEPDFLVVTHPHVDHINGLPALQKAFPQASVIAGSGAEAFVAHPKTAGSLVAEDPLMGSFMRNQGVDSPRPPLSLAPSLAGALVKKDGETLDLGGRHLQFILAEGHAPGSLDVWLPDVQALMASDSLGYYQPGRGFFPLFFTGYAEYQATIDRLWALGPRILGLAHQGLFEGSAVADAFRQARRDAEAMLHRIMTERRDDEALTRSLLEASYCDELTIYTRENIIGCCRLLIRRSREYEKLNTGGAA